MWVLLSDTVYRRRWFLGGWFIGAVLMGLIPQTPFPEIALSLVILYGVVFLFMLESALGTFGVHAVLPLSRAVRGRVYWAFLVPCLLPAGLALYGLLRAVHTYAWGHPLIPLPNLLALYVLLAGLVSGMSLLVTRLARSGALWMEYVVLPALFFLFSGPLFAGSLFFAVRIAAPATTSVSKANSLLQAIYLAANRVLGPSEGLINAPNLIALAAATVLIVIAYALSARLPLLFLGQSMAARRKFRAAAAYVPVRFAARWRGFVWPWKQAVLRMFLFAGLIVLGTAAHLTIFLSGVLDYSLSFRAEAGSKALLGEVLGEAGRPTIWVVLFLAAFFGVSYPWFLDLRGFRALPLSARKRSALLLSFPLTGFLFALVFLTACVLPLFGLDRFLMMLGWAIIALAIACLSCGVFARHNVVAAAGVLLAGLVILPVVAYFLPGLLAGNTTPVLLGIAFPALAAAGLASHALFGHGLRRRCYSVGFNSERRP